MKKIYEGRTKEDAIREACKDLGVQKEDLAVNVLEDEEPKKTMFNILDRKRVKITVTVKQKKTSKQEKSPKKVVKTKSQEKNPKQKTGDITEQIKFLEKVLEEFSNQFKEDNFVFKLAESENNINVVIDVEKKSNWIGYRGKTLNALQSILTAMLASNFTQYTRVYVNVGTYKEERKKQLESLANKVSKTVQRTKKRVTLEPMSSYERKIIHDYISKDETLKSESVGEEPNRKVVISIK